jgi:hypothetical protein
VRSGDARGGGAVSAGHPVSGAPLVMTMTIFITMLVVVIMMVVVVVMMMIAVSLPVVMVVLLGGGVPVRRLVPAGERGKG